jgi:hypothetical protein
MMPRLLPEFVARRVRWMWWAGVAGAVWMNRRDVARWLRFGARSVRERGNLDRRDWLTEARVRAAISADPTLRADPDLDDVVVDDGAVTVRTSGTANWNVGTHLDALRRVKGVSEVTSRPAGQMTATVPLDEMDAVFD